MALKAIGKKLAIGTGVGILDLVTENLDARQGLTKPLHNISDILRIGLTIGGYGYAAYKGGESKMSDTLSDIAMVYEPLAIRSIFQAVTKTNLLGMSQVRAGITQVRAGQGYASAIPPAIAPPAQAPSKGYRTFVPG